MMATLRSELPGLAELCQTMNITQLSKHYGVGHQCVSRHLARAGLTAAKYKPATVKNFDGVDGIGELAKTMHIAALARHYGMTPKKMNYRLKTLGITAAPQPRRASGLCPSSIAKYADIAERCKEMHVAALARHYGVTDSTMSKALSRRGLAAAPAPVRAYTPPPRPKRYSHVPTVRSSTDTRAKSPADLAADYLRRECPIWRCDKDGRADPKGKFFKRAGRVLAEDDIIARAEAKGWEANSWRMVA